MAEHPNAAMFRKMMEDFNAGRPEASSELLADDVEWYVIGQKEPIRGKEAMAQSAAGVGAEIQYEIHDVLANDDHLVALGTATARKGDKTLEYKTAEIMHVKNGKVTQRWAFSDDTEAINRFFS